MLLSPLLLMVAFDCDFNKDFDLTWEDGCAKILNNGESWSSKNETI